ncbi:ABC transporter substrate-binding protein [Actinomyces vulturis]|uniref:ABC transporter substrate-binding protein n=1 Tax=Actinomyces vulturis TaxID=1857645 RepID=UPI00082AF9BF|nr:ABC transporter substrate-binding protein [Actinomyces vulturis]
MNLHSSLSRRSLLRSLGYSATAAAALITMSACSSGTAAQKAAAQSSATQSTAALKPFTIGLTYTPNIQFAPFYLAAHKGYYQMPSGQAELRHHGAQEGLFDALIAGTEDLVVAGADEATVARSNGADLVIVGGYYQTYPVVIIVDEESPIHSLTDLRGKTVGIPGHYGENYYGLTLALQTAGLTPEDLTIEEIGWTQAAALIGGKVDAIVGFVNNDAVMLNHADHPVRTLTVAPEVPLIGASLITTPKVLTERAEDLQHVVKASALGMDSFVDDPAGAVQACVSYVPDLADAEQAAVAQQVAIATAHLIRPSSDSVIGSVNSEHVGHMLDFLASHELLGEQGVTVEQISKPVDLN